MNTADATDTQGPTSTENEAGSGEHELDWTKPGPGSWQVDLSHYEGDSSRLSQRSIEIGMKDGMAQGFEIMGGPIKGLEAAFVNGFFYQRMVPLVAGDRDLPLPPAPVLWLLTRIHPAFRQQAKKAAASFDERRWNDELRLWQTTHRPQLTERCLAMTALDPQGMDDRALATHLRDLIDLVNTGATLHFRLHVSDLAPIGLLLVKARDWGLDQVAAMATLAGSSPATSAPKMALGAIAAATAGHGPFDSLDQIRAVSPEAAAKLDAFIEEYGWRLTTGYDLQDLTLIELPELILTAINAPSGAGDSADLADRATLAGDAAATELRGQLDPADHDEFDRLVSDARALYGLRDENGPLTYQWPAGLLRRGLLEAAARLQQSGKIGEQAQIFGLEADELINLLVGEPGPGPDVLAERLERRRFWKTHTPPAVLGPVEEPPPAWTLPPSLAKMMDVITTVLDLIETDGTALDLDGIGIGTEAYVGRARVVTDELDALARMEPGDVLIAPFTVPTYNAALASAGAVVVENGGLLCHAAVIAREYGIPGLVGTAGATTKITDGAMVRVDPVGGSIRELDPDSLNL